jgi:hypothetical protein
MTQPNDDVAEDVRALQGVLDDEGMGGPEDGPKQALDRIAARASAAARLLEENRKQAEQMAYLAGTVEVLQRSDATREEQIKALAAEVELTGTFVTTATGIDWHAVECIRGVVTSPGDCSPVCSRRQALLRRAKRLP